MERKSPALMRATTVAITGRDQAVIMPPPPPEPEAPDPFTENGASGNRKTRRAEGHRGGRMSTKALPSQAAQRKRRKLEAAGRKAARKGRR